MAHRTLKLSYGKFKNVLLKKYMAHMLKAWARMRNLMHYKENRRMTRTNMK